MSKSGDGFDLEELMGWVGKAYNSPNADVRSGAVQVRGVGAAGKEGEREGSKPSPLC